MKSKEFESSSAFSKLKTNDNEAAEDNSPLFLDYFYSLIQNFEESARWRTLSNYRTVYNSFRSFLNGLSLTFDSFTSSIAEKYSDALFRRGLTRNSVSFHMRILRAVYNRGVENDLTIQKNPFKHVYTGVDKARKRAVSEKIIAKIASLEIKNRPRLSLARDLFMFSFYTRGMPFIDMAFLKKRNIKKGYILYQRHKTGKQMSVKIEPKIKEIIKRYEKFSDIYIFPIINSKNSKESYMQYEKGLRSYNFQLSVLTKTLSLQNTLSSYTSRHSWATIARNKNIPLSVISAALGHSDEGVTLVYLDSIENSVIDKANRQIINLIKAPKNHLR